jgi:group I intron endonuclease
MVNISPLVIRKRGFYNSSSLSLSDKPDINKNNFVIQAVLVYKDINAEKVLILNDNKGKTGIYRWTNKVNNKTYIGSALDLRTRFWVYFSSKRLLDSNMPIYRAIIKYGYANLKLEILEYCEKDNVLIREQYYIDFLKPEYNILNTAGSSEGYTHTAETLEKFKLREFSDEAKVNISLAATGRVLDEKTRIKISKSRLGIELFEETKAKISAATTERIGVKVEVNNIITGEIKEYETLTLASLALRVSRTAISKAIKSGKLINNTYIVKVPFKK